MNAASLIYEVRCQLAREQRAKGWRRRVEEKHAAVNILNAAILPFEREGYGVNKPGAWSRLYGGLCRGYYRDFGWRAVFLGGGE